MPTPVPLSRQPRVFNCPGSVAELCVLCHCLPHFQRVVMTVKPTDHGSDWLLSTDHGSDWLLSTDHGSDWLPFYRKLTLVSIKVFEKNAT